MTEAPEDTALADRLEAELAQMAATISVPMDLWDVFSNRVLLAARRLRELGAEVERLNRRLAKCGGDNCMGQEVDGCMRWVTEAVLKAAEARISELEAERRTA